MKTLASLFENNRAWAARMTRDDPEFFSRLVDQQAPRYLWIGCSDSRVPANEIVGLAPGELFVHRNVANLVSPGDLNCLSVLQYAVDVLGVGDIIVCGHYGCGGVRSAMEEGPHGLIDEWLEPIRELGRERAAALAALGSGRERLDRLCEWNVLEQVRRVARTAVLRDAWRRGRSVNVHGWIYALSDGLLRDLEACVSRKADLEALEGR